MVGVPGEEVATDAKQQRKTASSKHPSCEFNHLLLKNADYRLSRTVFQAKKTGG